MGRDRWSRCWNNERYTLLVPESRAKVGFKDERDELIGIQRLKDSIKELIITMQNAFTEEINNYSFLSIVNRFERMCVFKGNPWPWEGSIKGYKCVSDWDTSKTINEYESVFSYSNGCVKEVMGLYQYLDVQHLREWVKEHKEEQTKCWVSEKEVVGRKYVSSVPWTFTRILDFKCKHRIHHPAVTDVTDGASQSETRKLLWLDVVEPFFFDHLG